MSRMAVPRDIGQVIYGTQDALLDYLKQKHLIAGSATCQNCSSPMDWKSRANIKDGYTWRCRNPACRKMLSIRHDSFFENSKLPLSTWLHLLHLWAVDTPNKTAVQLTGVSEKGVVDVYNFIRDVCSWKLLQNPIMLGGPGTIVQIDESLFKHKPKYHRGRATHNEQWVFGMVDTSVRPALGYMELVDQRNTATLLPIIQNHIRAGSTIHSDEWRAYMTLQHSTTYTYAAVNHSLHFVDPVTGVHTQHIEGYWSRAKSKLKRMHGTTDELLPTYLDEYMWRERHGGTTRSAFDNICGDISVKYPVPP